MIGRQLIPQAPAVACCSRVTHCQGERKPVGPVTFKCFAIMGTPMVYLLPRRAVVVPTRIVVLLPLKLVGRPHRESQTLAPKPRSKTRIRNSEAKVSQACEKQGANEKHTKKKTFCTRRIRSHRRCVGDPGNPVQHDMWTSL